MNRAFNHGSQGDFFERGRQKSHDQKMSKAPVGVGAIMRAAALEGDVSKLSGLAIEWSGDSVVNEPDEIGTTPLHTAASHGHLACVQVCERCLHDERMGDEDCHQSAVHILLSSSSQIIRYCSPTVLTVR